MPWAKMSSNETITKSDPVLCFFGRCRAAVLRNCHLWDKKGKLRQPLVLIFARKSRESRDIRLFFAESFGG